MSTPGTARLITSSTSSTPSLADIVASRVALSAREVDADGVYPRETLRELGQACAYAHHVGQSPDYAAAIDASALVNSACLSTGFSVWCQSALALYLDYSPNASLKSRLLPAVSTGKQLGGTGLSNPMKSFSGIEPLALSGQRVADGFVVNGRLPWVSNIEPGHIFAIVFATEAGASMAIVSTTADGITLVQGGKFIALEGTATRTVAFRNVFIPDSDLIAEDAQTFVPRIRQGFIALQLGMPFGLTTGMISAMQSDSRGRKLAEHCTPSPDELSDRLDQLRQRLRMLLPTLDNNGQLAFHRILALRRDAALLTLDASRAELIQSGAKGYLLGSPQNRRHREAHFVAIVTPSIKHIEQELAHKKT